MAGRILYKITRNVTGDKRVKPIVLSKNAQGEIEELINRQLKTEEITSICNALARVGILMTAEFADKSDGITSPDIKRTLASFEKLTPSEAFPAYAKGETIRRIIDQVLRMELGINWGDGTEKLMLRLGLTNSSSSQEFTNALGDNIKKAAAIALEYYPYSPLNPRPSHLQENGKPAIGHPIRRNGRPIYRYRQKLAKYALKLWTQLGMEPCKALQWGDKESPIVRFMNILTRVIEPSIDSKEIVSLLKAAGEWKHISPEEASLVLSAELSDYQK